MKVTVKHLNRNFLLQIVLTKYKVKGKDTNSDKLTIIPLRQKSKPNWSTKFKGVKNKKLLQKNKSIEENVTYLNDLNLNKSMYVSTSVLPLNSLCFYSSFNYSRYSSWFRGLSSSYSSRLFIFAMNLNCFCVYQTVFSFSRYLGVSLNRKIDKMQQMTSGMNTKNQNIFLQSCRKQNMMIIPIPPTLVKHCTRISIICLFLLDSISF